jgi:hypothetical protein
MIEFNDSLQIHRSSCQLAKITLLCSMRLIIVKETKGQRGSVRIVWFLLILGVNIRHERLQPYVEDVRHVLAASNYRWNFNRHCQLAEFKSDCRDLYVF